MIPAVETPLNLSEQEQRALILKFFGLTGYGDSDLLSLSYYSKEFLTRNGGNYRLGKDDSVLHLAGPSPDPNNRL